MYTLIGLYVVGALALACRFGLLVARQNRRTLATRRALEALAARRAGWTL